MAYCINHLLLFRIIWEISKKRIRAQVRIIWHWKGLILTDDYNRKQDWMHNELKTGDPAYDGKYHPEHYHSKGSSVGLILIVCGILELLGGGAGIYIGLLMIVIGIFAGRK